MFWMKKTDDLSKNHAETEESIISNNFAQYFTNIAKKVTLHK